MDIICSYCHKMLKNPVECKNCHTNFCEEHKNDFHECPNCYSPFSSTINIGLKKIITQYENKIENDRIKAGEDIIKCTLCDFEDKPRYFCYHLAEEHKKDLIEIFGRKKNNQIEKIEDKFVPKEKRYEKFRSDDNISYNNPIENSQINDNNFIHISSQEINKYNANYLNNEKKDQNLFRSQVTNLYYCEKENKDINCNCCSDHICIEGNCLCLKCMFYNYDAFNLKIGELYNKAGRVAKPENGEYHCGIKKDKTLKNSVGQYFHKKIQCSNISKFFCEECKELNKYKKIYLDYINKNIFS